MLASLFVGCPTAFVQVPTANCVKKDRISKPYFTFNPNGDFEYAVYSYLIFSGAITSMPAGYSSDIFVTGFPLPHTHTHTHT